MNVPAGPVNTWSLSKDSLLLRFYSWLYDADLTKVTFCKMFWAIVLAPAAVVLYGLFTAGTVVATGVKAVVAAVAKWFISRPTESAEEIDAKLQKYRERKVARDAAWKTRKQRWAKIADTLIAGMAFAADKVSAFVQAHPVIGKVTRRVLTLGLIGLLAAVSVGTAGTVVYGVVYFFTAWLTGTINVLSWAGIGIGGAAGVLAVGYGGAKVIEASQGSAISRGLIKFVDLVFNVVVAVIKGVTWPIRKVALALAGFFVATGRFLYGGYHMVKYRTCPNITVTD